MSAEEEQSMLTTIDNPYDPFTQWDEWFDWDTAAGYYTPAYLARVVVTSDQISDTDQEVAIENAIDDIVRDNVLGLYKKVTRKYQDSKESG